LQGELFSVFCHWLASTSLTLSSARRKATLLEEQRDELLRSVGNVLHPSVPVSDNEDNNLILRTVGKAAQEKSRKKYSHVDLIVMIDGVDTARGTVAAGNRVRCIQSWELRRQQRSFMFFSHGGGRVFCSEAHQSPIPHVHLVQGYYLKGAAVCLETALVAFAQQFLMDRDFTALSPPVFMRKEVMQEVSWESGVPASWICNPHGSSNNVYVCRACRSPN
jgi:seryl-tRNA synthetase